MFKNSPLIPFHFTILAYKTFHFHERKKENESCNSYP